MTNEEKAKELLSRLSVSEKLHQLTSQIIFDIDEKYESRRDPLCGNYRNPGHFMHQNGRISKPSEVAHRINLDVKQSIEAQPHHIPPIEHGEALHGAQWGMASIFPQPIGLASTFDPELVGEAASVIGKEAAAVGVRQALSPVVNVCRDVRWGRTVETFGEDVKLCSDMGAAVCRGLEENGVAATPKHFVDNCADGGRDSNHSVRSERELREVYLKPFEACFKEGGAHGVMASYNSLSSGLPAHADPWLLTKVLREEWGFDGIVVSDYGGVDGVYSAHRVCKDGASAIAKCIKAGLDCDLPNCSYAEVKEAYDRGLLTSDDIDRAVFRILKLKFDLGLFDCPYVDEELADRTVRCDGHKRLAVKAAEKSMVLLKNDGVLPLDEKIGTLGIFGPSADILPTGSNYSGPYAHLWEADDVLSPLAYFRAHANGIRIITGDDRDIPRLAPMCDAALYFTSIVEGEGLDRSDLRLPSYRRVSSSDGAAVIVDKAEIEINVDQEKSVSELARANPRTAVILMNGAPVDMSAWIDAAGAVLEAWYPGEGGSEAIYNVVFGACNPGGKLPVSWPRSVGQLPLYYSFKPSGRGYGYENDDGTPLYPFGYGKSYTSFSLENASVACGEDGWRVTVDAKNTGDRDGDEVVQVYLSSSCTETVQPLRRLVAYRRVTVPAGGTARVSLGVPSSVKCYYDADMVYAAHGGDFRLLIGTRSDKADFEFEI